MNLIPVFPCRSLPARSTRFSFPLRWCWLPEGSMYLTVSLKINFPQKTHNSSPL